MKPIPGYEGLYSASEDGRIYAHPRSWRAGGSHKSHNGFWLAEDASTPYLRVTLTRNGLRARHLVHRLVALAWHGNADNLPEVNHKNGNKRDNRPENLEWCTKGDNERHAWATGLKKDTPERREQRRAVAKAVCSTRRKLTFEQATRIRELRRSGHTISEIARHFGVQRNTIYKIIKGEHYVD